MPTMLASALLLAALPGATAALPERGAPAVRLQDVAAHYAGWAMEAYPGDTTARLGAEMRRQVQAGANVVWLGHNNPGNVGYGKREPGLSYAVWATYRDAAAPKHGDAVAMVQAQQRALDAARALGVKVVLPIGYQTQMGLDWNVAHPGEARRSASGAAYDGPDPRNIGASFYAPDYRRNILSYYRWIEATFVRPYSGAILMLNLADEPHDGDYSTWADRAFRATHGYGLRDAGANPARQEAVGRFEAQYVAAYADWSARQWLALDPALPVTMSFDGGYSRYLHEDPDLEAVFRQTPANFVVTFDAYPRDGLYNTPLRDGDLVALFTLVRTLGYYSALYRRPLWLWSAANSWGLNEASSDPGHIADAVANAIYLAQLVRQTGGELQGLAVWNYNIKGQGLYNDTHRLVYQPDQMFARVSASFALLRATMAGPAARANTVLLAPAAPVLRALGVRLALRTTDPYHWAAPALLARTSVAAVALTSLASVPLSTLRAVLVLARSAADVSPADRNALRGLLSEGGTVVAAAPLAATLAGALAPARVLAVGGRPQTTVRRLPTAHGILLSVDGGAVEDLFADANAGWAAPVWSLALHRAPPPPGYMVSAGGVTLLYSIARQGALMSVHPLAGPTPSLLTIYDTSGAARRVVRLARGQGPARVFIARRSYALLTASG